MDEQSFATERDPRLRYLIPGIVAVAFLMQALDSTIVTTAIPDMAVSLATTPVRLNLAVTAYVLTLAVFIPLSGWCADRFGARSIFMLALATFSLGSALCGLADSFAMLIAMRILQGIGGAMMTPVGRLILLRSFPRSELVTAMTYMTLPAIVGPIMGPLVGGFLTTYVSWRWIFYVNLPFGVLGIVLAMRILEPVGGDPSVRFDLPGFVLFGCGIGLLQVGIDNVQRSVVPAPELGGLFLAAAVLLGAFAWYARRTVAPVIDLSLFRERTFTIGSLVGGVCRLALNGVPFLLPLMLQVGFGMSAVGSGSLTFLGSAGAIIVRVFIAPLLRALGFRAVLIGSAVAGSVLLAGYALIQPHTPRWLIGAYVLLFGLCRSTQFMTTNTLAYADTTAAQLSSATSLGGLVQQLTVSFGVSLSAVLLSFVSGHGRLTPGDFHEVFLLMAIIPLLALPGFLPLRPADGAQVSGHRAGRVRNAGRRGP